MIKKADFKIGFIGLGLIGGSLAMTIRSKYKNAYMTAFDFDENTLAVALSQGIINRSCKEIDDSFYDCDYIFLCAPVHSNIDYLPLLRPFLTPQTILTDVGSVKAEIHEAVTKACLQDYFIGGHPMAGSEKVGFHNASDHLFENAYYILTPSSSISEKKIEQYRDFVHTLGTIPLIMDYNEHDYVTAAISHLPHIIASSLVNLVKSADSEDGIMKLIAAGGFKDITRIASSSPIMWQQICTNNSSNIIRLLDIYIHQLEEARSLISQKKESEIYTFFSNARDYRNSISDASLGPIKKVFAVYCDIVDESGAIATIATILSKNSISIKNIGIIHNREFEEGVLRIEFDDEVAVKQAVTLLQKHRYTIHERN